MLLPPDFTPPSVVVSFENGRLGNQFFQYIVCKRVAYGSRIFLFGMNALSQIITDDQVTFVPMSRLLKSIVDRALPFLFQIIRSLGIFSVVYEKLLGTNSREVVSKLGRCSSLLFVNGFFQFTDVVDDAKTVIDESVISAFSVKRQQLLQVVQNHYEINSSPSNWFFCHVRRGDYLSWPSSEFPAYVPGHWLLNSVARIFAFNPHATVFVTSDDLNYIRSLFSGYSLGKIVIYHQGLLSDFAMMTLCEGGGILSPSTFSLWGSYFARRFSSSNNQYFIAPLYWAGFRQKTWIPHDGIKLPWIDYLNIDE